ncbi:MAG: hypothetical protein NC225_05065 [Clostridium sp.]|nr:hypothetical protein [Clostridium sp.]MCM1398836.1 hypothetical protein [Clostridium sp.]MCM1458533.1 hypothetical protein [Bacteroides sp.]
MNEMIKSMSIDMKILPYTAESEDSFIYRVLFSALGQWCLYIPLGSQNGSHGTTKHNQTHILNNLISKYNELFPNTEKSLCSDEVRLSVLIRHIYQEVGYLFTDNENHNHLCDVQRVVNTGTSKLCLNLLNKSEINGLGVFDLEVAPSITWQELLIRDSLTPKQYINSKYDIVMFEDRDLNYDDMQFFNPLAHASPSQSWNNKICTEFTIGRKSLTGPFYLIQSCDGNILYSLEEQSATDYKLTAFEYRRLYFALKSFYNNPVKMRIKKIDNTYSKLVFQGHLPNREYYLLLLISWPDQCAFNKTEYIIKNSFLPFVSEVISNLGIKIIGG